MLSDFARRSWLGGQLTYHRGKTRELQRKSARFERAGLWMFGTAMAVAAAHLALLVAHALHLGWLEPPWLEGGLTWLALVLPVAGASIGGFRAHREYSRLAKRSAAMVSALEDMAARLERVSNPEDLEAMLSQIESCRGNPGLAGAHGTAQARGGLTAGRVSRRIAAVRRRHLLADGAVP